jgi:hypothetical protein
VTGHGEEKEVAALFEGRKSVREKEKREEGRRTWMAGSILSLRAIVARALVSVSSTHAELKEMLKGKRPNAPQDDDDRTLGIADHTEPLPHHQRRREDHGKVEGLGQDLWSRRVSKWGDAREEGKAGRT